MDNWQPGDLALCVNTDDRWWNGALATAGRRFRSGAIYTVAAVLPRSSLGLVGLHLALKEDRSGSTAAAWRFRKINPLTDEERRYAERELLTGKPVKEDA